jgi:hypothetical protein
VTGKRVYTDNPGRGQTLKSVPGRGCQLPPFTRRFRLGFALLRGGSRINHHGGRVLALEGCPLVHSILTPLTIAGAPRRGIRKRKYMSQYNVLGNKRVENVLTVTFSSFLSFSPLSGPDNIND